MRLALSIAAHLQPAAKWAGVTMRVAGSQHRGGFRYAGTGAAPRVGRKDPARKGRPGHGSCSLAGPHTIAGIGLFDGRLCPPLPS